MSIKFGMIGGGVMGEALLSRLIAQQIYPAEEILVSDPQLHRRDFLAQQYGVQVTADNRAVAASNVLLLAVKPQVFEAVVADLADDERAESPPLVISIMAGVSLSQLEAAFSLSGAIRAMPNTPATVGAGMTALARGKHATNHHLEEAKAIFQAVGEVVEVPESLMDAVTGLSGSGPGYVAIMVEALTDGGVAAGLPRAIASSLALQTVLGTAQLLHESGLHPAELKDRVTSPGGTTIAGIAQLERSGFRSALIEAVVAASRRSQELGK
ncbi:pyrroline-5-carboxylate reductase [Funiculus sociatus GB2-A5]|uniref:Pyrroline-5-carboxylate reductase n=1 Tax=Funiculus sociatus GB2-A5 TaxID=2933946 RepID=A0ABV0JKX8_9CYAN|nr:MULTISPECIES: pyrroline-5-carboxylate reductase [unclassified Trichocoleus]MBD1904680.1 pyrroline-5-carboxylate reductase [Trichocoleus sp. FACHB-832]MBD2062479.1 pyrroline-5-carboxylate reductase [Trichocoleus sp. FACHB-6]